MCLIARFFPYSYLGRPLASRPTQAALREKSWDEKQQQILPTTNKCPLLDVRWYNLTLHFKVETQCKAYVQFLNFVFMNSYC